MLVPITSPHTPGVASAHSSETSAIPHSAGFKLHITPPAFRMEPCPQTLAPGRGHPARDRFFCPVIFWESLSTQPGIGPDDGLRREAKGAGKVHMLLDHHPGGERKRRTGVLGRGQALRPPPSEGKGEPPGRKGRVWVPPSAGLSAPVIVRCLKHHSLPDRAALGSDTGVHRGVPTGSALNAAQWHLHFHPYTPPLAARRPFPPKHQATREPFEGKVVSPVRL